DPLIECGIFDVILMLEIFEHLIDPLLVLIKLRPLLKHSGLLILSTPNAAYIKWRVDLRAAQLPNFGEDRGLSARPYNLLHKPPVTLKVLKEVLKGAGFRVDAVEPEDYGTSDHWSRPPLRQLRNFLQRNWSNLFAGSFVVSASVHSSPRN